MTNDLEFGQLSDEAELCRELSYHPLAQLERAELSVNLVGGTMVEMPARVIAEEVPGAVDVAWLE